MAAGNIDQIDQGALDAGLFIRNQAGFELKGRGERRCEPGLQGRDAGIGIDAG